MAVQVVCFGISNADAANWFAILEFVIAFPACFLLFYPPAIVGTAPHTGAHGFTYFSLFLLLSATINASSVLRLGLQEENVSKVQVSLVLHLISLLLFAEFCACKSLFFPLPKFSVAVLYLSVIGATIAVQIWAVFVINALVEEMTIVPPLPTAAHYDSVDTQTTTSGNYPRNASLVVVAAPPDPMGERTDLSNGASADAPPSYDIVIDTSAAEFRVECDLPSYYEATGEDPHKV